eukprot:Skav200047  [mRNA]  locus=scaffold337:404605:405108:+ [translate_table: standard]
MRSTAIAPDVITYNALISASSKGQQWQEALSLLELMPQARLQRNVISSLAMERLKRFFGYTAVLGHFEKQGHWQHALGLFRAMLNEKVQPDHLSYSAWAEDTDAGRDW